MQVAQVKKCTSYRLFLFRTIRKYLPLEIRIKYYDYYVKPLIEYCSSVWGICTEENQTKIKKKAARLILEAPPLTPSKQMFQQLKWLPINEIVKRLVLSIKQLMVMRLNIYRLCLLILKTIRIIHLDLQPIKNYSFLEHIINPYHTQA